MNPSQRSRFLQWCRWAILIVVGFLGIVLTLWVNKSLLEGEQDRLEHRFRLAASARTSTVIKQILLPTEHLATLQRLFGSLDHVDWSAFTKFSEPMLSVPGIKSFIWLPRIEAPERLAFESRGQKMWGTHFAIVEQSADGQLKRASERKNYFPLLYVVPEKAGARIIGYDGFSFSPHAFLINQAVESGLPSASTIGQLFTETQPDSLLLLAPVYRGYFVPATRDERWIGLRGMVAGVLNIKDLFSGANSRTQEYGFNTRLLDLNKPQEEQVLAEWGPPLSGGGNSPLVYSEDFELANYVWSVQITAAQDWLEANRSRGMRFVLPLGFLLTFFLLLYLRTLLGRSALADSLEITHESDMEQRRIAEIWAGKLSMAVEQNPASILITDLNGRIEYVNAMFEENTGYSREEAIGQKASILKPAMANKSIYRQLRQIVLAGHSWNGELQNKRRDGTLYWERVQISPIKNAEGEITNYVAIMENITELRQVMTRLQESESRFRAAVSVMVEGLAVISPEGRFVFANRAADEFMGCTLDGLLGRRSEDIGIERLREDGTICPPSEYPSSRTLRDCRGLRDVVIGFRYQDGSVRWLLINTSPLRASKDDRCGVVITMSDITERRGAEEQLKLAFEAIRCSGEGILVTDANHCIVSVNPAFEKVTGFSSEEAIGKTPMAFASGRHDERFHNEMQDSLKDTGHWQGEVWNQRKNGEVFPEWLGVSVVQDHDGHPEYYVYIYSDMTERKEAQQRIELLAHHDPLTGLPNRLLLRDRVEQAKAQAGRLQSRVALMFLDLDRFKTINDSLGHPVGDELLIEVVDRLKSCVRESDTISRQGGDEFIILLNDVRDSEAVSRIAEKIHQRMAEPLVLGNHLLNTSFSIGVALYPDDGEEFDILLQKADTAMYHAKESGRNAHRFFTEQMNQQVVEHLTLETQLRKAIENKEFILHYQPQMDLHEGKIVGVEALIRWNSPEKGLISPAKFIPVAEDSGLIVPIGAWVLNEACHQARAWQDAGLPPFVVAVNLSAVQFKRMDLVSTVINALVLSDLDSQWLELELTESILIQDAEATLDSVRRLKALGVKLSVDDFGTGYSSLTYLKRFAVDKLKIDQSFVRDLVSDPDDAAIVRAIIQMSRSLKLKTIAEGVESEELSNLLRVFHCDEIQGYWFARPMPANDLEAFIRNHLEKSEAQTSLA